MPLPPTDLLILLSLADDRRHGYGIRTAVIEMTEGAVRVDAGNLYRRLKRLVAAGLVERDDVSDQVADEDPRRRYYGLTTRGKERAVDELQRLKALVHSGPSRRLLAGEGS